MARNINDDVTLAYLFKKTKEKTADALAKAVEKLETAIGTINNTITTITTNMPAWVYADISYVSGETVEDKLARLLGGDYLPRGRPFIGYVQSDSRYFVAGYLYTGGAALYGSVLFHGVTSSLGGLYGINNWDIQKQSIRPDDVVQKSGDTMTGSLTVDRSSASAESDIIAKSKAGQIFLFSGGTTTGHRGVYCTNAAGTSKTVIGIDQSNNITLNGNAANVTGTVAIGNGGTGQTSVSVTTTVSSIATAGTNISITGGYFYQWGKVAHMRLTVKPSANISSGSTIATIVSGKRPTLNLYVTDSSGGAIEFATNGAVIARHALTSGTYYHTPAVFLIAN